MYPCPCCGYLVFKEPPGSYKICRICGWEDDAVQLRGPHLKGGPNHVSLVEAQKNYLAFGAKEERGIVWVRKPTPEDIRDPGWRPLDPAIDNIPTCDEADRSWPSDDTELFYWRDTYWRRPKAEP